MMLSENWNRFWDLPDYELRRIRRERAEEVKRRDGDTAGGAGEAGPGASDPAAVGERQKGSES